MEREQATNERYRSLFINITVAVVLVSLTLSIILYLNDGTTDFKRIKLEKLNKQFIYSVNRLHWQWQGEGRPHVVISLTYANRLDENDTLIEIDRKSVLMSHRGWPKAESTSKGCANIWNMVLNTPMDVDGFKISAEHYDEVKLSNNTLDSVCRYRLSAGPYFEYKIFSGQVLNVRG